MGSLKALQEWCRIQCEDYPDVVIKDMSTSFRDGLAFCALIHRHRPDLIDLSSLSKENVYENNRLAFEVAETQLGIPALLDPEDLVSMKVPDRLSIITYVSQYYNFFNNKSHANPPCMKRPSPVGPISELAQMKPALPLDENETGAEAKRSSLSSTCSVCNKHVHLVQRFLVDGKLFHRNCFRCTECHSTLLPGSYKLVSNSGSLVCTHHFARHGLSNQNGRPDLSKKPELSVKPVIVESVRIGRSPVPYSSSVSRKTDEDLNSEEKTTRDTPTVTPVIAVEENSIEKGGVTDNEANARPSTPPNPFDDSDEEEEEDDAVKEEQIETPAQHTVNGDLPSAPVSQSESVSRPVPAPRRVSDPTPPPRPAPRVRLPPSASPATPSEPQKHLIPPKPRERSQSPGSLSGGSQKSKDPPWLALVQSQESKKKKAPPPPVPGLATPPNSGSVSSLKGDDSRSSTPPVPANPFEDDEDDVIEEEEEVGDESIPSTVAATHPWYSIRRAADSPAVDASPSRGSASRSESPAAGKTKKRPAPRVPPPPSTSNQALSPSQPSSCSASPALSTESLSSSSEQRSAGGASSDQEQTITKSTSEPSIASPDNSTVCSLNNHQASLSPSPPHVPSYTSSAPATPQAGRSSNGSGAPSPLASNHKRICKENPFNRKASPSAAKSKGKPPKGPRPARPPAPGHGFPLIKRKVQSDQYIPTEDIYGEMSQLEKQLDELEQRGVELEKKLRDNPNDEDEEHLLVDWFTLIHEKHLLVRREAELVYTAKQQNLEERQADVEYELRCLLNKPEKDWTEEDKAREQELMAELVTIIEQRNQIVNTMDQDRQREEEEDKLMEAMLKKKDFSKEPECDQQKKKGAKFKHIKVLKRLSHKGEPGKSPSLRKEKS
ncbi:MICAL-like protein 1 isoform X2 [Boleophthalmus pectinirostris]|uniref:MICAL-like protein 1 isoform X2 n=1 Tax=Boleophthalmus pectinirostris TaxID=150288 RepID=UPI000A1C605C|nr:MICAL-like protein 1 isoform X2 [Boleophthalmus pectinirostris]